MSTMTPDAFNAYLTWIIYAAVGQTAQSDALLREHKSLVLAGAKAQRAAYPIEPMTLYRGILLEPEKLAGGQLHADTRLESVSYSEDLDVAQFFADTDSIMGGLVMMRYPKSRGYIIQREVAPVDTVLFHHSWSRTGILMPRGMPPPWNKVKAMPLGPCAVVHLGEDLAFQFSWAVRTQKEVILLQDGVALSVEPRENYPSPSTAQLDDRFVPPTIRRSA